MKTLSWKWAFMNLLFVININEGETTVNTTRFKRDDPWYWTGNVNPPRRKNSNQRNFNTRIPAPRTPSRLRTNSETSGRRVSEIKCLEYIRIRKELTKNPECLECIRTRKELTKNPALEISFAPFGIGGTDVLPGEFPHMGALGWRTTDWKWRFICGSSLISHKFALTAAHCSKIPPIYKDIVNRVPEIVRFGTINIIETTSNRVDANIKKIIVHPQYSSPMRYYDIALLEFTSNLQFTKDVQPVCIWNRFDTSSLGTMVASTGWGVVDLRTRKTSPVLQKFEINTVESEHCDNLLSKSCNRYWCGVRDHQMCAGKVQGGVDACQGDSGGPLQVKMNQRTALRDTMYYMIGVTSFGVGCARPNQPGVYTRVSSFIDWIEKIVWPK